MRLALVAPLCACWACWTPTEIVVTIDTPFGVPCTIDALHVEVANSEGVVTRDLALATGDLPGSLTLTPKGHSGTVNVSITALRRGEVFATAQGGAQFDRNISLEMRFVLDRSCVPGPCAPVGVGGYAGPPAPVAQRGCGERGYAIVDTPPFAAVDACQVANLGTVLMDADEDEKQLFTEPPFPLSFYGKPVTGIWVGTNGYVAFSDAPPHALNQYVVRSRPLGEAGGFPVPGVLPFWDDLRTSPQGICYAITGTFPDRLLWMTWKEACISIAPTCTAAAGSLTVGVALEETSDKVFLTYGTMLATNPRVMGITATTGVIDSGPFGCSATECSPEGTCMNGMPCGFTQVSYGQHVFQTVGLSPQ